MKGLNISVELSDGARYALTFAFEKAIERIVRRAHQYACDGLSADSTVEEMSPYSEAALLVIDVNKAVGEDYP